MRKQWIVDVEAEARRLGHDILWGTIGDNVAHGHCKKCQQPIMAACSARGLRESGGAALEHPCPRG